MLRASRESKRLSLTLESAGDSKYSGMGIEMEAAEACIRKDAHRAKASKSPKLSRARSAHQVYKTLESYYDGVPENLES